MAGSPNDVGLVHGAARKAGALRSQSERTTTVVVLMI
jgi:hypothetical protein